MVFIDNFSKLTCMRSPRVRFLYLCWPSANKGNTWMDLNGVYYPVYESAFDSTLAGRSPLYDHEIRELTALTGINIWLLDCFWRELPAQISFDRPEVSPCLDKIRNDKQKYARAVEIIRTGQKRLKATPRGDIEKDLVPCERHKAQLRKYAERLKVEQQNCSVIECRFVYRIINPV